MIRNSSSFCHARNHGFLSMRKILLVLALMMVLPLVSAAPAIVVTPSSVDVSQGGTASYNVKVTAGESGNYWVDASWQGGAYSSSSSIYLNAGQSYTWNVRLGVGNNFPSGNYSVNLSVSNRWNAYGTLRVIPVLPICTSICTSGQSVCDGNGYKTCGDYNRDGCTEWSSVTSCGDKTCSNGGCYKYDIVNVSIKQIYILDSNNNLIISDSTSQKRQINAGDTINLFAEVENTGISGTYSIDYRVVSDEAHKWEAADSWNISKGQSLFSWRSFKTNETWPSGKYYYAVSVSPSSGASVYSKYLTFDITGKQSCANACASGQKRCSGHYGYEACGDYNNDSCLEWPTYTTPCPNNQSCQDGNCVQNQTNSTCSAGFKCKNSSLLAYQSSDCSWGLESACQYGCGNDSCNPLIDPPTCPPTAACNHNGVCDKCETLSSCPDDCSVCGDGICTNYTFNPALGPVENILSCPQDCYDKYAEKYGNCILGEAIDHYGKKAVNEVIKHGADELMNIKVALPPEKRPETDPAGFIVKKVSGTASIAACSFAISTADICSASTVACVSTGVACLAVIPACTSVMTCITLGSADLAINYPEFDEKCKNQTIRCGDGWCDEGEDKSNCLADCDYSRYDCTKFGCISGSVCCNGQCMPASGTVCFTNYTAPGCIIPGGCAIGKEGPKNSLSCSDGFDNDNDGLIDGNDPDCQI